MKKPLICAFLCFCLLFFGCKSEDPYLAYVSEARRDIFSGQSDNYDISAFLTEKEYPYLNDGIVGEKGVFLEFRLNNPLIDGVKRSIAFSVGDDSYSADFAVNEVTGVYGATAEIADFTGKSLSVSVICGEKNETVILTSEVPENALSFKDALKKLSEGNPELLALYKTPEGVFDGEIRLKILLKNGKPYWYAGLCNKKGKLKALLLDGITGETLAVREIF